MHVRQGTVEEMLSLWYKKHTSEFMADRIKNNKAEFWTIELDHRLVGELYAFFELDDNPHSAPESGEKIFYSTAKKPKGEQCSHIAHIPHPKAGRKYFIQQPKNQKENSVRI